MASVRVNSPGGTAHNEVVFASQGLSVDVTTELNALVEECLGGGATSSTRKAKFPIRLGPGYHVISGDSTTPALRIASAIGMNFTGSGQYNTVLCINGTNVQAGVDLNGLSRSTIGGFSINQLDSGDSVQAALHLRWGSGIGRSTNYNTLFDIGIESLKFVEGIRLGEEGRNNQVDTTKLYNCLVKGQRANNTSDGTYWKSGIAVGHNVYANNLNHTAYGCSFANCDAGIDMRRSQFSMYGGEMGGNGADIYVTGHTHYLRAMGVRSEGSQRLLSMDSGYSSSSNTMIEDYDFHCNELAGDGRYVVQRSGGVLTLRNLRLAYAAADTVRPKIYLRPEKALHLILDGHYQNSPMEEWLEVDQTLAAVSISGQGWNENDFSSQPTRMAPMVLSKNGAPYALSIDAGGNVVATLVGPA